MAENTVQNAQKLRAAVDEWAANEIQRLRDQATFLRSIQGSEQRISAKASTASTDLAFNDVTEFLKT